MKINRETEPSNLAFVFTIEDQRRRMATAAFELALVLLSSTFPQFTPIPVLLVCLDLGALVEWLPLPYFPRVLVLCKARYCCLLKKA